MSNIDAQSPIDLIISPRKKDLGGFEVRRVLPYAKRRTVGPFIFFDHMGPAKFAPGEGIDVRAHGRRPFNVVKLRRQPERSHRPGQTRVVGWGL